MSAGLSENLADARPAPDLLGMIGARPVPGSSVFSAAPNRFRAVTRIVSSAVGWWLGELASLAPRRLLAALDARSDPATEMTFTPGGATLIVAANGPSGTAAVPLRHGQANGLPARVHSLLRTHRRGNAVSIRLDPALVFETSLTLPAAAEASLEQVVRHQLARIVPLPAEDVTFVHDVSERSADGRTIGVRIVMTKRRTIERALEAAQAAGLAPRIVSSSARGTDGLPTRLTLWRAQRPRSSHPRALRMLEACALLLVLLAYGLHVRQLDNIRDELAAQVAAAGTEAEDVQRLVRTLARSDAALAFFAERRGTATPLRVIDELTRVIPPDSWVTQLSLQGQVVELTGLSPRATDLIPRLEASELFAKPRFQSAITRLPGSDSERFSLRLLMKTGTGQQQ